MAWKETKITFYVGSSFQFEIPPDTLLQLIKIILISFRFSFLYKKMFEKNYKRKPVIALG